MRTLAGTYTVYKYLNIAMGENMYEMNTNEKKSKNLRLDGHTQRYLDIIMESGDFTNDNDAIRAAIVDLGKRYEQGEFTKKGRKV